jgi:hypothetical protein
MQGMLNGEVNLAAASEYVMAEEASANQSFYIFASISKFNIYDMVARTDRGISSI